MAICEEGKGKCQGSPPWARTCGLLPRAIRWRHCRSLSPLLYNRRRRRLPLTRLECELTPRPCTYASCRYILAAGECALDYADRGGMSLGEVGSVLGLTRERVRQIEEDAMQKVADLLKSKDIDTLIGAFTHRTGPE